MRKAALLALLPALAAALVLAACQKPHGPSAGAAQGENVLREALAKKAAGAAAAGPQVGVTQISTSGSPRGFSLKLPSPRADVSGRSLTVSLPFRPADGLVWSVLAPGGPWRQTEAKTSPGAGPEGTDLAVFSFKAGGPGSGVLTFQLNPPKAAAKDSVMTYQATVIAP